MKMEEMLFTVQLQLAAELNCKVEDLNGEKDSFIFTCVKNIKGRRPFPRNEHHFEMVTMGKSIVITASEKILEIVKPQLLGKSRDQAFSMPFVYGHAVSYLPDLSLNRAFKSYEGFDFEFVEQKDMCSLYKHKGFSNAIQYDTAHIRPDALAIIAKHNGEIAGISGASRDCEKMWQIGVDVLPQYRSKGLATCLVNNLTAEVLSRGIIPYYCTSSSNLSSQRVAYRAGYYPAWFCSYKGNFDGFNLQPVN